MDRDRLPKHLQNLIGDVIVSQYNALSEERNSEPGTCYNLNGSFLNSLTTTCLQLLRVDRLYMTITLERALILYFSATKQFHPLHVLASNSILLKDSICLTSSNDELRKTIREEFFEKRSEMIDYVTSAYMEESLVNGFIQFIEMELPSEAIPPTEHLKSFIKTASSEKVKRLNIEKNMLTEKELQTDQMLNNGEVTSIIRTETTLVYLQETLDDAYLALKRHYFPCHLSYSWTADELDDTQVKNSMINYVKNTLKLPIEPYEFIFRIFTYKSGHGAAVAIIPANICAPTPSNVKVIIIFSSFAGAEADCKMNVDHSMDIHTALWRNIEAYLEETVYNNETVNKKTSRGSVDYYLGGYSYGGTFCQLTAVKLQDNCGSVVATTLDSLPLFKESKLVPVPVLNPQKVLVLNILNLNDVKIKRAKLDGCVSLGAPIPFMSADNGLNSFHDYKWLHEVDFSNLRFVDPINVTARDQEVNCLLAPPLCKMM